MRADVLVLGEGPHPPQSTPPPPASSLRVTPFGAQRLWQGVRALQQGGLNVAVAAECPSSRPGWRQLTLHDRPLSWLCLNPGEMHAGRLRALLEKTQPRCLMTFGPYKPAQWGATSPGGMPTFIDLPGDLMAEAQLRAEEGDEHLARYYITLSAALARGDAFGVCSTPQRRALLGQLGLSGRLKPGQANPPILTLPPDLDPLWEAITPSDDGLNIPPGPHIALIGSTNSWFDTKTTLDALDRVFARQTGAHLIVTGGALPNFNEGRHRAFQEAIQARPWGDAAHFIGWMEPAALAAALSRCTVALCIDKPCAEAELGARTRLLLGVAQGLRWVVTPSCEMAQTLVGLGLGEGPQHGDADGVAQAVQRAMAAGRLSEEQRRQWGDIRPLDHREALVTWAKKPQTTQAPHPLSGDAARLAAGLQSELDDIYASATWRALNAVHRLLQRIRE